MTLIHIYDKETGKLMRSQEPKLDVLETKARGENVYVTYANSTDLPLPEYGEHEKPFFIDGAWVVKGQYKNLEVYDKDTKSFTYCYQDELKENEVFIDDKEGIERFKQEYQKYVVDEETWSIVENPKYPLIQQLNELNNQYNQADTDFQTVLDTPVVFPLTGKLYKPRWTEDGTYANLITAMLAGIGQFPIAIWDATKLEENMVMMDEQTFGALCAFLANIQQQAFDVRKQVQSTLLPQIDAIKAEIGE